MTQIKYYLKKNCLCPCHTFKYRLDIEEHDVLNCIEKGCKTRGADITELMILLILHFGKENIYKLIKTYPNLIEVVEE